MFSLLGSPDARRARVQTARTGPDTRRQTLDCADIGRGHHLGHQLLDRSVLSGNYLHSIWSTTSSGLINKLPFI